MSGATPRSQRCSGDEDATSSPHLRRDAGGNCEGHNILNRLDLRCATPPSRPARRMRGEAAGAARVPHQARPRRQGAGRLERPDDRGPGQARPTCSTARMARGGRAAFDFVCTQMTENGRLLHSYRASEAKAPATATDYANMIGAALGSPVRHRPTGICRARARMGRRARPALLGGGSRRIFSRRRRHRRSHRAPVNALDDATPNANGAMVSNLMQLYLWTGEERYRDRAEAIVKGFGGALGKNVFSHTGLLARVNDRLTPAHIVVLIVPNGKDLPGFPPRARRCVAAERGGAGGEGRGAPTPPSRHRRTARPRSTASPRPMSASARNALCR